jgi:general secretion pathway protein C
VTPLAALIRLGVPVLVLASLALPARDLMRHRAGEVAVAPRPLPAAPEAAPAPETDFAALDRLAPFGAPPPPDAPAVAAAPPLDLVLQGVMVAADPRRSAAFLRVGGRTGRVAVGAEIAPGIILTAAATDHVRLEVEGAERVLRFPDAPVPAAGPEEPDSETETAALAPGLLAGMVTARPREAAPSAAPETVQDHIDLWRGRIRRNPGQVLDVIGLVPGPDGYTIAAEHARGLRRIGLVAGDRVVRVNGEAVGDVARDRDLYDKVAASGLVTVEIAREEEIFAMSFPLR